MAIFKCKMCGGSLEVSEGMTVCECEYCGTTQTLPKLDNEKRNQLFDRANYYRMANEFDNAAMVYENILAETPDEAEAHWGMCLCRYGIEYVTDPKTQKRIPTCHRTQFKSILEDPDYLAALNNADSVAQSVYKSEAEYIDSVQKGILEISNKEEPFDIFICYKETDNAGNRTIDSVIAQDIYTSLTDKGYKVFFARITLEDKLGSAYEPYIFAALNSSKIMLVVGTKPEYFSAVWVKNEWSRYLMLIEQGQKKTVIPCYRDMSPYDMPDEFSALQSQDVSKVGYMQDLLRGIDKIVKPEPEQKIVRDNIISSAQSPEVPLIERGYIFLEDEKWDSANEYFEKALDTNPKSARAYLGKLLADLKLKSADELEKQTIAFDYNDNYKKAIRFGDEELIKKLENSKKQSVYNVALENMKSAKSENEYRGAKKIFISLGDFSDSATKADECESCALETEYNNAVKAMESAKTEQDFKAASKQFEEISAYRDSADKAKECLDKAEISRIEEIYRSAVRNQKQDNIESLESAIKIFESISDYKDSREQTEKCRLRIEEVKKENAASEVENQRRLELVRQVHKRQERKKKIIAAIASGSVVAVIAFIIVLNKVIIPNSKYNKAMDLYNSGNYTKALSAFEAMNGYKDSADMIAKSEEGICETRYNEAMELYNGGEYKKAISVFSDLDGYKDSEDMIAKSEEGISEIEYNEAMELYNNGGYNEAISAFSNLNGYKDSTEMIEKSRTQIIEKLSSLRSQLPSDVIGDGYNHTVGVKSDGTAIAVGEDYDDQCDVSDWSDVVAVSVGYKHTVGLKSDGTVVAVGDNDKRQCNVSNWTDMIAVSAGRRHTVALTSLGYVRAVGDNSYGQCTFSGWSDIVAVSAGDDHTVGLKSDGTVVAVGDNYNDQCKVSKWNDIVAVAAGESHTVGLKSDGTVVAKGESRYGKCDVSSWTDIVAVSANYYRIIGLKSDGTVVATRDSNYGWCDTSDWKDIKTTK